MINYIPHRGKSSDCKIAISMTKSEAEKRGKKKQSVWDKESCNCNRVIILFTVLLKRTPYVSESWDKELQIIYKKKGSENQQ